MAMVYAAFFEWYSIVYHFAAKCCWLFGVKMEYTTQFDIDKIRIVHAKRYFSRLKMTVFKITEQITEQMRSGKTIYSRELVLTCPCHVQIHFHYTRHTAYGAG